MQHGLVMVTISSSDELIRYVNAKRAGVVLAGPTPSIVTAAHSALLGCECVVPCVRLLAATVLETGPSYAAPRPDPERSHAEHGDEPSYLVTGPGPRRGAQR